MTFDGKRGPEPYHDSRASIEHLIPLNKGGENTPENVVLVCHTCNLFLGDGSQRATREQLIEELRNTRWVKSRHGALVKKRIGFAHLSELERQRLRLI